MSTLNITGLGGAGTHTLRKTNVNLDENYVYFPGRSPETTRPADLANNSAYVVRETTGDLIGIDSNQVYFIQSDNFSVAFAEEPDGQPVDITGFNSGSVVFDYPFVLNNSFNISNVRFKDIQAVRYLTNSAPILGLESNEIYYVKNLSSGLGGSVSYQFTSHTFTTCGQTGQQGPTLTNLRATYNSEPWMSTFINIGNFRGYQDWVVPETGVYEFTVKGAPGRQGNALGGGGAIIKGRVVLQKDEIITIAVGQRGELPPNNTSWPASSGGTFVVRKNGNIPLFVAGGGSASSGGTNGFSAVTNSTFGGTSQRGFIGGANGNGAGGVNAGGAGGGFFSAGGNSSVGGGGGGFNNGLVGGFRGGTSSANGGFGGGGGSDGQSWGGPGGAGGYGGGATNDAVGSQSGGGGGSFIFSTATDVATSNGLFNGANTFNGVPITNLNTFNSGAAEGEVSVELVERSVFGFELFFSAEDAAGEIDPIAVEPAGSAFHALIPVTYDTVGDKISFSLPHGYVAGDAVTYTFTGTAAGGIQNTPILYVNVIDAYTIRLSTTPGPGFNTINLTSPSAATNERFGIVIVNTDTNEIKIPNHGFLVDQPIRYSSGGGVPIFPLQNGATYFVKQVVDENRITLSQSLQGPTLNLTTSGTGTRHSFILNILNQDEDSIFIPSHGYVSGQTVRYQKADDLVVTSIFSSGTSRHINTATNHNLIAGNRITFDGFIRDSIPAPQIVITQFASSGQTRTLTTAETHNLFTGAFVEITGFTGDNAARFNGVYIVTGIPTTNQINYTAVQSVNITNQNTNVTSTILQRKPEFEYLEHTRKLDIISISSSGTTRTITTRTPHYYSTGSVVFISGINLEIPGIQGNIGEYFNGAYLINGVPNLNTFTYIGEHEEPSRTLNNNISFGTTNLTPFAEVYREIILDLIPSATQIRYQMPSSSFSTSTETAVRSRVSRTGSRLTNRELINTTTGRLNFNARHGLIAGDRFTVASMSGNNQDVFNGEYRVRNVLSETQFDYTPVLSPKPIRALSLSGNTNAIVEMQNPHNLVNGNWVYLDDISGNDNDFWNMRMVINGVASEGTSRTLYMENANQMFNGQRFRITEMSEFAEFFVGEWVCTGVPDNSRITFTGVGNAIIGINLTVTGTGYRSVQISTVPEFSITSRFKTGNIADIQLNTTHGLEPGDTIRINNISGANPELFNGEHVVTSIPSTSRVTFVTQNTTSVASAGVSGTLRAVNQIRYGLPTYNVVSVTERELISHTLARYSTNFDHRLEQGSTVTVSGMTGNNTGIFNGTFVVASTPTARVFTVVRPPAVNVTTFTVSSRFRTLNVADVTFNTTHNLQIGNTITITNMSGTSGSEFNGTHVITGIPATNRVTFTTANSSNIANEAASGNITVDAVQSASSGGTITLNTIPRRNLTSGTTTLREVSSAGFTGELISNTAIPGLENQRIYFVQRVDANTVKLFTEKTLSNPVDIKGVGIGAHSIVTFSVDYEEDTITIPNHGFTLGELVEYDTVGNTEIAGLSSGTPYYIIPIDGNTFRLATSNNNAENGIFIDLTPTPSPTGRHKLKSLIKTPDGTYVISDVLDANTFIVPAAGAVPEIVKTFSPRSSLDATLNHIKVASHGFITGTKVTYSDGNETPIGGLTSDTDYFVIVINKDYIRLAETAEDAKSGNAISLTTFGAGLSHTLTSTQINGQIVGTGTLTTEAGSALVDGSGTSFSKILKVGDQLRIFPPDQEIPSFFAASDVNTSTETITLASHPFETGDAVVFNPGSGGPIRGIHQIASSGQTRTIRTREAHGYTTNQTVTISGLSSVGKSDFEGTFTITGTPDVFQFTYTASTSITLAFEVQTSGTAQTAGAAGSAPSPLVPGNYFFIRSLPNTSTFSINNRNRTDNILDFTTTVNHNLRAGNTFTVSNISGVNPEVFNGTFVVAHIPAANRVQARATVTGTNLGAVAVTGDLTPLSSNSVTVHNTRQDAIDGTTEIDLASQGSGFALKFSKIVPVGPIVREISAIGSDTQVTVSRPYNTTFTDIAYSYPTFVYVRPQGYSLHRPFDGGVEMSTGFGTWYGSIIRQTRKYFRYQSGKGLQTSAGINFKPSIDIEAMTRVGTSNSIAIRTRRPHGLVNGLVIRVDEAKDSFGIDSTVYNGEFQVTVIDSFNMTVISDEPVIQPKSYGFPRLHVTAWTNGALRSGMFDDQNGMFYEFDGEKLYAVRRSSTQQIAGTCAALRGSQFVFGTNTNFTSQLVPGDFIVLRGQSYKVASIENDTQITIKPEFKGSSGTEVEFNPGNGATGVVRVDTETFNLINHGFTNGIPVVYNSIDGQPIGGLRTGVTYYVDRIDSNNFRLKTSPGAAGIVNLSSAGTGDVHSFTPAKTGIIATLTEDTRIPQEDWSIDPCDGTGPTGYNLDLSKIQMIYIDYSWYGAGKIRFGFKTISGQVQYVHEFVHNNIKYESYFRSGNLPARYEVVTYDNPTYIPSLFHWGTSVIMDGTFDDDRAYLFTKSSPSLNIGGTTAKTFGSSAVNFREETINVPSHGFANGDEVQFLGTSSNGQPQVNTQNPATQVIAGQNEFPNLTNEQTYIVRIIDTNNIILYRNKALASVAPVGITSRSKSSWRVTINTVAAHGYAPGDFVWTYLPGDSQGPSFNGVFQVITVPSATQYTYDAFVGNFNVGSSNAPPGSVTARGVINITSQGNSQATYTLTPAGTLNNTSGSNYQPLISLRLSPSVSEGLTGGLGDRDVINRMQLRLQEIGVQTNQLIDVKLLLNGRLNNLNFQPVDSPSLVQVIEHTSNDTISGGIQVYNFKANGLNGAEQSTNVDVDELFELSNSILGGNSVFPDGPDIVTIAVARLTGQATLASAKMSWAEAQA